MSFLTAGWRKLAIANYEIDPTVLAPYIPYGTELDLWQGRCYASLIGFMFVDTRLLGIKIPFHVNFEEVNLRFYVRRQEEDEWRRGVVFIKEIVPRAALSFVANTLYNEHYETLPMRHSWATDDQFLTVAYGWKRNGEWQSLEVRADKTAQPIAPGSVEEFITEHYWGYAQVNDRKTNEYQVTHPRWEHYPVQDFTIRADFARNYGADFGFMNNLVPASVMLAEGSAITVESKRTIRARD